MLSKTPEVGNLAYGQYTTGRQVNSRMYIYILLDTVLATDVNKYSLASARCQPIWRTRLANLIYF